MSPTLENGEFVVIHENVKVNAGDVVLARHPFVTGREMIKRVESFDENGSIMIIGDNPSDSTDSRTFGAVPIEYLKGKVVARLS